MGRFNPKTYNPQKDSTPGYAGLQRGTGAIVLKHEPGHCLCGCGEVPVGLKTKFRMGHDAKLRGKLIRAHLTDTPVVYVHGNGAEEPVSAKSLALQHGWEAYLESAEQRRAGANKALLHKAIGSKRLIKVGRWEKTGQVVAIFDTPSGQELSVEYVTATGEKRVARVPADKAPLAAEASA